MIRKSPQRLSASQHYSGQLTTEADNWGVHAAGNLRTSDFGGPYNLSLLNVQEAEVKSKPLDLIKSDYRHQCDITM